MTNTQRNQFEQWYACNAFNYERDPIGSRDCGLQWAAWQAAQDHVERPEEWYGLEPWEQAQQQADAMKQALKVLKLHHASNLTYTNAKLKANATCASFTINSLSELIESGYTRELGKITAETISQLEGMVKQ